MGFFNVLLEVFQHIIKLDFKIKILNKKFKILKLIFKLNIITFRLCKEGKILLNSIKDLYIFKVRYFLEIGKIVYP